MIRHVIGKDTDHRNTSSELRLGLVGCGRVAQRGYVAAARRAAGVRLVAVADLDRSRCEAAAPGVQAYEGARALVAAGDVDALVLATPASAHLADARVAAEASLPTLVEKPPGVDASEAAALAALDPPPWISFNRRFEPALTQLRAALPSDAHLDLAIEIHYRRAVWQPYLARYDALLDLGPHLIDLVRWLTGTEPRHVRAASIGEPKAILELDLERGRARIEGRSDQPYRERVEARDLHGRLIARYACGGLLKGALARLRPDRDNPIVASLTLQLEAFARAARGGAASPLATAADGLAVMTVIDAARDSAAEGGRWCPVKLSGGAS